MSLTIGDLEAALTDRTSEVRELEAQRDTAVHQLDGVKRTERTREVVGRVFADSLSLVRSHDERELRKEIYSNSPDVERTISAPLDPNCFDERPFTVAKVPTGMNLGVLT